MIFTSIIWFKNSKLLMILNYWKFVAHLLLPDVLPDILRQHKIMTILQHFSLLMLRIHNLVLDLWYVIREQILVLYINAWIFLEPNDTDISISVYASKIERAIIYKVQRYGNFCCTNWPLYFEQGKHNKSVVDNNLVID